MMKWLVGVSIVSVAMGWVAVSMIPAAPVAIDDPSFRFLPPETQAVAFIDAAALRSAPLVQEAFAYQPTLEMSSRDAEFFVAAGINPLREINKVTFAKIGAKSGFAVLQGQYDRFKVEQLLKDSGKQVEAYLGQNVYRNGDGAFVLFDSVVVAGDVDGVKKAIDQMQLPGSLPLRSDLMASIQTIEAGNQVWAAGDITIADLGSMGLRGPAPVVEMLKSLKGGTYQMRVDSGIHARITGNLSDFESAKNLADLARGALALAKMQVGQKQPDAIPLLDGIQVSNNATTLTIDVEESGDLLKKLKDFYRPTIERQ
jgi:hypothetical protein